MTTRNIAVSSLAILCFLAAAPLFAQATVEGTLKLNNDRLRGTHANGELLLFSPDPVQLGSSLSHWDTSADPNLLMEPSISRSLGTNLDVTPGQMQDVGWSMGSSAFNVVSLNGPGEGFTDPTPFAGAAGNPATTLGEARVNLFNQILSVWASTLNSSVEIDVDVLWDALPCDSTGAVLAAASTIFVFQSDTFPVADTWYHSALAEALSGEDLTADEDPDASDIIVFMNSEIDNGCLPGITGYYYGLDSAEPDTQIDVVPVVLHELAHGLGFSNFTNENTGEEFQGTPSIYDHFTVDNTTGETWAEMNSAERAASAVRFRQLTWSGEHANALTAGRLDPGVPELTVSGPSSVAGTYEIGLAQFGAPITEAGLAAEIACMRDLTNPAEDDLSSFDGCTPATNPGELEGKLALVDRGACDFVQKARNAQAAGAVGVIIANNASNFPLGLGGTDPEIVIPAVSVGQSDGARLRQAICPNDAAFLNDGRFEVTVAWEDRNGMTGRGQGTNLTNDTAWFYFFNPDNVELVVKVLDACDLEGFNSFWVFAAGLTNVEVQVQVLDTQTGVLKTYTNPLGTAFQPIQDTQAFMTCP